MGITRVCGIAQMSGVRRFMRLWMPSAVLACLVASPAAATGSFSCSADDKNVSLEADAAFSYGLGRPFNNFRSALEVKTPGTAPDLARIELDGLALTHHWLHGKELKLHLYREREGDVHGSVELIVEARQSAAEETVYSGRYRLIVFEGGAGGGKGREHTYKGKVACSVG